MIEAYSWPTPNGHKIHIMLEELGCAYKVIPINIRTGDQLTQQFKALNPNGKIPVIIDPDGPGGQPITVFESGAILLYLAEKFGRFLPNDRRQKYQAVQWLMLQMGSIGPMLGQAMHFHNYAAEPVPYAIQRYTKESQRLYEVLNEQLSKADYIAGRQYTIADMAIYPWARFYKRFGVDTTHLTALMNWLEKIKSRPAVRRGLDVLKEHRLQPEQLTPESKALLFSDAKSSLSSDNA